jgi:hypothetical protein
MSAGVCGQCSGSVEVRAFFSFHLVIKMIFQKAFEPRPRKRASSDETVLEYVESQRSEADKGIGLNANWNQRVRTTGIDRW